MAGLGSVAVLLLHGLPDSQISDAFQPMSGLITALGAHLPQESILTFEWRKGLAVDPLRPALTGRLGRLIAQELDAYLQVDPILRQPTTQIILGGYSSGGWGIYDWLAHASSDQRSQIAGAFTIGAPFQSVRDFIVLGDPGQPV